MLQFIFAVIILAHGFIHLMGFGHELNFAEEDDATGTSNNVSTSFLDDKVMGLLWLISYGLFLTAVILLIMYIPHWWIAAAAGVLLSQTLIFLDWQEAKYGTITNIIILLAIIPFLWQQGF